MSWWAWLLIAIWGPTSAAAIVLSTVITVLARFGRPPRPDAPRVVTLAPDSEAYPSAQRTWETANSR